MNSEEKEINRIKEVYEKRKKKIPSRLYSYSNPGNLFIIQEREREVIEVFKKFGINSLEDKKILDIGCGTGGELRRFIMLGAKPENLYGIDLLEDRIEIARKLSPNINFVCGNAEKLPFENDFFDIVMQFTVFTSILEAKTKRNIAKEMLRVLKPSGIILWYDFFMNNPKNPDVRGVKKKEIYELFPNCKIYLKRITLAPPLVRLIAPRSFLICYLLGKLPLLKTHYLGVIKKL